MKKSATATKSTPTKSKQGSIAKTQQPTKAVTTVKSKSRASSGDGIEGKEGARAAVDPEAVLSSREEMYKRAWEESTDVTQAAAKPKRISLQMVARRNLAPSIADGPEENLIYLLSKLTHLRLDREGISRIDDMDMMGPITNLYLQQNYIGRIENLDSLPSLRFVTLAGNQIRQVENLRQLNKLRLLDLSSNRIQELDVDQLPRSLMILDVSENPCCQQPNYRQRIIVALPKLMELDGREVTRHERLETGCEVSSASSDSEEEESGDDIRAEDANNENDVLDLSAAYIHQSRQRLQDYTNEHQQHVEQLIEARSQSQLAMDTARSEVTNSGLASALR